MERTLQGRKGISNLSLIGGEVPHGAIAQPLAMVQQRA